MYSSDFNVFFISYLIFKAFIYIVFNDDFAIAILITQFIL